MIAYSDSNFGRNYDDRTSTSGWIILLNDSPVVWKSRKQRTAATSTTEAEFIAANIASKHVLWVRNVLQELNLNVGLTDLFVDNQPAVTLIKNNQVHEKTLHLDVKLLSLRDLHNTKLLIKYIAGENQLADFLTKPLNSSRFSYLLDQLNFGQEKVNQEYCNLVVEMKPQLVFLLVINSFAVANSFLLRERFQVEPNYKAIAFGHSCDSFKNKHLEGELNSIKSQQELGKLNQFICRSQLVQDYEYCLFKHAKIMEIVESFNKILLRPKRSVTTFF